jgi:hypothetical protein
MFNYSGYGFLFVYMMSLALSIFLLLGQPCALQGQEIEKNEYKKSWLAGDHHIHSRYSVVYDQSTDPPTPIFGYRPSAPIDRYDGIYPIPMNALMARNHGLDWIVATDHGGPNHSKINLEYAYPELLESRQAVPDLIQFYGMELNTPGGNHSSLIIPHHDHEHKQLYELESRYDRRDKYPQDPGRNTEEKMIEALNYMNQMPLLPVLIVNHPSRSADSLGSYGAYHPAQLRDWNDTAPRIAIGMEGAPGHQAEAVNPDGSIDPEAPRAAYRRHPTYGGYDQMTAILGGFWDSMLGEGRNWSITATSDMHGHWRDGGDDFWPGEYSKTFVYAQKTYDDILEGLRSGRVFVTTGDLVSELYVTAETDNKLASIGEKLPIQEKADVIVTIRLRDLQPPEKNPNGDTPEVTRVDLITGEITGTLKDRSKGINRTTRVEKRFTDRDWKREGDYLVMSHTMKNVHHSRYIRVRGTNTDELEPEIDPPGEDPWTDLWFYSNPVFIEISSKE